MFIPPKAVLSRSYSSLVSGAKTLKVRYHLVWWGFLLVNWFCGLKATCLLSILQPNQPDWTWRICAHIFSLFLPKKKRKGWAQKASFEGGVWNPPWRKNRAFHLSFSLSLAYELLTKAADRRVQINSMEPPDESKGEKERRKTEKLYEDFTRRKAKITHGYWLVLHLCLHTHTQYSMNRVGGGIHKLQRSSYRNTDCCFPYSTIKNTCLLRPLDLHKNCSGQSL